MNRSMLVKLRQIPDEIEGAQGIAVHELPQVGETQGAGPTAKLYAATNANERRHIIPVAYKLLHVMRYPLGSNQQGDYFHTYCPFSPQEFRPVAIETEHVSKPDLLIQRVAILAMQEQR